MSAVQNILQTEGVYNSFAVLDLRRWDDVLSQAQVRQGALEINNDGPWTALDASCLFFKALLCTQKEKSTLAAPTTLQLWCCCLTAKPSSCIISILLSI